MSQTPRSASASRRRAADDELGGEDELRGAANHSARCDECMGVERQRRGRAPNNTMEKLKL
jgi:hypothetical protein